MKIGRTEYAEKIQFYSAGYERVMVPGVFAVWAKDLLETAALAPGMRALNVACGTGIVTRLTADRVAPSGSAVGLDANEAMLTVARAQPAPTGAQLVEKMTSERLKRNYKRSTTPDGFQK